MLGAVVLGRPVLGTLAFGTNASVSVPFERGSSFGFQRGAKSESAEARSGLNAVPGRAGAEGIFNEVAL